MRATPTPPGTPSTPASNLTLAEIPEALPREDFGRDKDLKSLLKSVQPEAFSGEGLNVANSSLEEWIISMDDYFALAEYNSLAQSIMARAKLIGPAKMWWKLNCQSRGVAEVTQSWEELQFRLKERYLPLNHTTNKMNEFLSCVGRGRTIDTYYEEFVKLSRYAPLISEEQKPSRFILVLEGKLADEVEAIRPTSLADALIRAKPKLNCLLKANNFQFGERKREPPQYLESSYKQPKYQNVTRNVNPPDVQPVRVNALPITQGGRQIQCFECLEWGHKRSHCPRKEQRSGFQNPNQGSRRPPPVINTANRFQGRNFRPPNPAAQCPNPPPPTKTATINHVSIADELEEHAQIYAALDPSGRIDSRTRADFRDKGKEVATHDAAGSTGQMERVSY